MTNLPPSRVEPVGPPALKSRPGRPTAKCPAPRQTWTQTRRRLQLAVDDLRRAVVERCETHPDRARLTVALDDAIVDLEALIDGFDRPLIALLDAADATSDRSVRDDVLRRVGVHVADGRQRFACDDLVELMDTNGFVELGLRSGLDAALVELARRLGIEAAATAATTAAISNPRPGS
ncbi:hypothetical protein CDL60_05550 [Roseateles noduli]|nr:hypothetical protein CDL60_05550 [Roseateles noduli]